jgi:hypothetical protein
MKYLLMLYNDESGWGRMTRQQQEQGVAAFVAYTEALRNAKVLVDANRLAASNTATTVRVQSGKTQVLDGPYADSKEKLGGYYLIDVPDLDKALSWAARCPAAEFGTVEVRPLFTPPA